MQISLFLLESSPPDLFKLYYLAPQKWVLNSIILKSLVFISKPPR